MKIDLFENESGHLMKQRLVSSRRQARENFETVSLLLKEKISRLLNPRRQARKGFEN